MEPSHFYLGPVPARPIARRRWGVRIEDRHLIMVDQALNPRLKRTSRRSLAQFAGSARRAVGLSGEVQILITSNRCVRELNRRFRKKDQATDVLSFPASLAAGKDAKRANRNHTHAGDIAISAEIAAQQAEIRRHSLAHELKVLILHGMLHLAGYDHETDHGTMARREEQLRERLGLREGLIRRAADTSRSIRHRLRPSTSRAKRT